MSSHHPHQSHGWQATSARRARALGGERDQESVGRTDRNGVISQILALHGLFPLAQNGTLEAPLHNHPLTFARLVSHCTGGAHTPALTALVLGWEGEPPGAGQPESLTTSRGSLGRRHRGAAPRVRWVTTRGSSVLAAPASPPVMDSEQHGCHRSVFSRSTKPR